MPIRIDIQVGSQETFAGFVKVQNQLKTLKAQQDQIRRLSTGSGVNKFASSLDKMGNAAEKAAEKVKAVNEQLAGVTFSNGYGEAVTQFRALKAELEKIRKIGNGSAVVERFAASLERMATAADKASGKLKDVNLQMSILRSLSGNTRIAISAPSARQSASGGTAASTPKVLVPKPPAPPPILDPDQAQRQSALMQSTNPSQAVKLHNQANAARKRISKQQAAKDPNAVLQRALMRTRWSQDPTGKMVGNILGVDVKALGRHFPGLAQQIMSSGGGGGAAGGADALGAASSAIAGIKGLGPAALAVSAQLGIAAAYIQSVNSQVRTRAQIGGSARESVAAATIASAIGLGPNAANQLSANIAGGGAAASEASKAGINLVRGPYGDTNDAKAFNQAVEYVARSKSFDEARQKAVRLGTPELASAYYLSENTRKRLSAGSGGTEEDAKVAAEFNAEMAILTREFQKAVLAGKPLIRLLSSTARGLTAIAGPMEKIIDIASNTVLGRIVDYIEGLNQRQSDTIIPGGPTGGSGAGVRSPQTEAVNRNTKAVDDLTRTVKTYREVVGGGERAKGALPKNIGPGNIKNAMKTIELGLI